MRTDVAILIVSLPSTMPDSSNLVKVKLQRTPRAGRRITKPIEIAIAKLFIKLRKAAPSFAYQ